MLSGDVTILWPAFGEERLADSIVQQLYQRKMFRITAGYLAVAWVLWQVVGTTCPAFDCGNAFQQSIFWFLIAGLPITLAIAWVNWRTAILVGSGLLAGAAIMFFVMRGPAVEPEQAAVTPTVEIAAPAPESAPVVQEKSIAVLPFVNMSDDREQEYFSDGISEEILNGLAKVDALRVAARTSSFYFKGKDVDLETIAEKLSVAHVLEGSVRKAGDRLRITVQLIKVDDGFHLWSESYDRELTDIFAVQDEIANAVVAALKIKLGVAAGSTLVDIGTTNREAYDWYLRGKDALVTGSLEGFQRAVGYFNQAIELDPDYADAHAYLAFAHILQHPFTLYQQPYRELAPVIKHAYSRALALEPSHSAALCARGYDKMFSQWDWSEAGKLFRAGTRDGKLNDVCLGTYVAWYLLALGQYEEAIALLRGAERTDPLNLELKHQLGAYLGQFAGEWEEGSNHLRAVVEAVPDHVFALTDLIAVHPNAGQLEKAESLLRSESLKRPNTYPYAMWLGVVLDLLRGDIAKAQSVYDEARRIGRSSVDKSPDLWHGLGFAAVSLGHLDEAISWFNRGFEEEALASVVVRPFVTGWATFKQGNGPALMAHPDFQAFLARMNLDDASMAALR